MLGSRADHPQLDSSPQDGFPDPTRIGDLERDRHLGVLLPERADQWWQHVLAGDGAGADGQRARHLAEELLERLLGVAAEGE